MAGDCTAHLTPPLHSNGDGQIDYSEISRAMEQDKQNLGTTAQMTSTQSVVTPIDTTEHFPPSPHNFPIAPSQDPMTWSQRR